MDEIVREWMDRQDRELEAWMAAHVEEIEREAYERWATDALEDGEDSSPEAYDAYIQSQIPDYA